MASVDRMRRFACGFALCAAGWGGAGRALTLDAVDFDAGNVRVSRPGEAYADGPACIWHGDGTPDRADYVVEIPVDGAYALSAQYAAKDPRPVEILVDDAPSAVGLKNKTGSWQTKTAKWEAQGTLTLKAGLRMLSLRREGPFPHICALRLEPARPGGTDVTRPERTRRVEHLNRADERRRAGRAFAALAALDREAVRLAAVDMAVAFPERKELEGLAARADMLLNRRDALLARFHTSGSVKQEGGPSPVSQTGAEPAAVAEAEEIAEGIRAVLLANPLLDELRLLVVRRRIAGGRARQASGRTLGWVPNNYLNHTDLPGLGYDNEIAVLTDLRGRPSLRPLYKPARDTLVRDVRLDFSGDRLLFSGIDATNRWAVFQLQSDGSGLEQVSPADMPDLDFFDPCYLPDGRIILCSSAYYVGVPCLDGRNRVSSLYLLDPAAKALRQLTFDQDHGNDPVVLHDGRVLYQRWEYSDIPHYFSRRRMTMNPDGTGQLALHGSNAWFPTAFRFARPVPGHPSLLVGVLGGHHERGGYGDAGRLALLDPALGSAYPFRYRPALKEWGEAGKPIVVTPEILPAEQTGFVQLIPGRGRPVAGTVCDAAVSDLYLKEHPSLATHPSPLNEKYFLCAMKPDADSLWGIYLVDVFDNATLIAEEEDAALFEPQPFRPRPRPPVIPDRVNLSKKTADVHIADIYSGPGLKGVPRGTVKSIRVFAYHFCYLGKGGFEHIGVNSGWDVKRVLGTARVEADGSACFQIPANTPVSLQPLDADGNAVQLMRSWLVGMPGERVSCAGCHEDRRASLPPQRSLAETRRSEPLVPWYGPPRPFAFAHEVYPVLERNCVGCHDGKTTAGLHPKPDFKDPDTAYAALHPYVRRAGVEGDMALLNPMEYHTSTSRLFQMLEKGHRGVTLAGMGREVRERLACWVDLNVPRAGAWSPEEWKGCDPAARRRGYAARFAGVTADPEAEHAAAAEAFATRAPVAFVPPPPEAPVADDDGLRAAVGLDLRNGPSRTDAGALDLGSGVSLALAAIPAGEFVMGSLTGAADERPRAVVRIGKPFKMSVTEITNGQYARFDPEHDTRYVDMHYMDHVVPGHIANHPDQPVARVSWEEAMAFCVWASAKTGLRVTLPTEAQWEWAARAGTATDFFYGTADADFGRFANLADSDMRNWRMKWEGPSVLQNRFPYPPEMNFPLHDPRFKDNWFTVDYVGQTEANAWGLKDMVGNVGEWTRSSYRPYPYADDARNDGRADERKVARGGSWADRPSEAGASVRRAYAPWQKVFDVGFRVVVEEE
jgi:formylglycine-generating enzyme required for sulfatase activity